MECDVVVVGAGISGLAVADRLAAGGRSVVVLESRDRVGGRLRSHDGLDLGASWFWPGETRVRALVEELAVPVHDQHLTGDAVYDAPDGVVRLDGNPIDVPAFRFSDGATALTDGLRRRFEQHAGSYILLGSDVHRVEAGQAPRLGMTVTGDRTVHADHVVLALPPALAVASIDFHPALPDALGALAARTPVWMGGITKAVIRYPAPFWRDAGLSGAAVSHRGPLREVHDLSGRNGDPAALFGFAPTTAETGPVDPNAVITQLVRLFGAAASTPLDIALADWRREPSTSPPGAERLTDYSTYGDPRFAVAEFEGRLHWASTETSSVAPGHIEGALAAAERTAATIEHALARRRT